MRTPAGTMPLWSASGSPQRPRQVQEAEEAAVSDVVLAFDFGGTKMAIATAACSGQILQRTELPTRGAEGAEQALARAVTAGTSLLRETAGDGAVPRGVGVSTMGITLEDHVLMAPNVVGWERQAIPS